MSASGRSKAEGIGAAARILVVEDDPVSLELVSSLLRDCGHEVHEATNGEAGLAAASESVPNLIISDLRMPGLDGYELARRVRRTPALSRVPMVALTAEATLGDREKALSAGFDQHVSKPFRPEALVELVQSLLVRG